jgi:hypothetical protein
MSGAGRCGHWRVAAGAMIVGWIGVAGGPATAQQGAEARENIGNDYVIGRRVTGQGTTIQTVLYRGHVIATDPIIPAAGGPTTGAAAASGAATGLKAPDGVASAKGNGESGDVVGGPRPLDFVGTLLSGEISGEDYFILHRTRTDGPPTHDIFRAGEKIGFVAEQVLRKDAGPAPGRAGNVFSFESADGHFIVHLTQPDGARIHATFENGRLSRQVVERAAGRGIDAAVVNGSAVSVAAPQSGALPEPVLAKPQPRPAAGAQAPNVAAQRPVAPAAKPPRQPAPGPLSQ